MTTTRGTYPGASEFARFDKPIHEMTLDECHALLTFILHEASPGSNNATAVYRALEVAEENAKTFYAHQS